MKRIDAISGILENIKDADVVFSSCGKISREVFHVKDRPRNFYVQGSMGACLPISMGFSLNKPELHVFVIIGDGEAMMNLNSLALFGDLQSKENLSNLDLYILKNNCYQSTGGQGCITADFESLCSCTVINIPCYDSNVSRITIPHEEITRRFMDEVNGM